MIEVRRAGDDELCGYVAGDGGEWRAMTVFGGRLGVHDRCEDAEREVLEVGLAALTERWTLIDASSGDEQVVCIQQASPSEVTLALDHYSLPGVPTLTISRDDLTNGCWRLERR